MDKDESLSQDDTHLKLKGNNLGTKGKTPIERRLEWQRARQRKKEIETNPKVLERGEGVSKSIK